MNDMAVLSQRARGVRIRHRRNTLQSLAHRLRLPVTLVRRLARLPMWQSTGTSKREPAVVSTLEVEHKTIKADDILTPAEVAAKLKVPETWVFEKTRRRCRNPIPVIRLGRYVRFNWNDVQAWLAENSQ